MVPPARPAVATLSLSVFALGYFALGTASLAVIGAGSLLSAELGVAPAQVGLLVSVFAVTFALSAPCGPALSRRRGRSRSMLLALTALTAGSALAAVAPDFSTLVGARVLQAVGAGLYAPLASSAGAAVGGAEHRQRSLAIVFAGMTTATVLGVPLVSLVADLLGWRTALAVVAGICGLSLILLAPLAYVVPRQDDGPRPRSGGRVAALAPLVVTAAFMAGQFVVYGVAGAYLEQKHALGTGGIALPLLVFGAAGVAGNVGAGWAGSRVGPDRAVLVALLGTCVVMAWLLVPGVPFVVTLLIFAAWGFCGSFFHAPQQARLVALADGAPDDLLAWNASALYLGMSAGSAIGALGLPVLGTALLPTAALVALAVALFAHHVPPRGVLAVRLSAR